MEEQRAPYVRQMTQNELDLRQACRFFYDLQRLRIGTGLREQKREKLRKDLAVSPLVQVSEGAQAFIQEQKDRLEESEDDVLKEMKRLLKEHKIYTEWLQHQRGCGVTMAAVIISSFDVYRAHRMSCFWAYAGLTIDPTTNQSVRRKKGEKASFDPYLKSKMVKILGECLIKAGAPLEAREASEEKKARKGREASEWYICYINRKHYRRSQRVRCMNCKGFGIAEVLDEESGKKKKEKCKNCKDFSPEAAPWGMCDAHRQNEARRFMVKIFLQDLWRKWRTLEGLEVRPSYAEERLGLYHHAAV